MSQIRDIMNDMKPVEFHPRALEFIRAQSPSIRRQVGEALRDLQKGASLGMPLSRPQADAIIVFHAFQKKSQKTPSREIRLARRRLQELLNETIES
jgi:phage-related protein